MRTALGIVLGLSVAGIAAGCGKAGSSGTAAPASVSGSGCAGVAGTQLVVLTDDKGLQLADNIVAAVNAKAATPELIALLDKVSDSLTSEKLSGLNKAVDVDRKTPKVAATDFVQAEKLTDGITKGAGGALKIGAADFSESQIVGSLYEAVLDAAGYTATLQQIGKREVYEPQLVKGDLSIVPEYAATLAEYLNGKQNGSSAAAVASGDVDKTMTGLKTLATKEGLAVGKASKAADQNAFAVTKEFSDKYGVKSLSEFATKCSGKATSLAAGAECPQRPFCKLGLEKTYGIQFGEFQSLDAGGPESKKAVRDGKVSLALVFTSSVY